MQNQNTAFVALEALIDTTTNDECDDVNEVLMYYPAVANTLFETGFFSQHVRNPEYDPYADGEDNDEYLEITDDMLTEQAADAAEALAIIIEALRDVDGDDEGLQLQARRIRDGIAFGTL